MNWLVLGNGFGWRSGLSGYIDWIYLAPGQKTQEGSISWAKLGINPRIEGSLYRSDEDLHDEVKVKALPLMKEEVLKRAGKTA